MTAHDWATFNPNGQKWAPGIFIAACRRNVWKLKVYSYRTTVVVSVGVFFTPSSLILYLRLTDRRPQHTDSALLNRLCDSNESAKVVFIVNIMLETVFAALKVLPMVFFLPSHRVCVCCCVIVVWLQLSRFASTNRSYQHFEQNPLQL